MATEDNTSLMEDSAFLLVAQWSQGIQQSHNRLPQACPPRGAYIRGARSIQVGEAAMAQASPHAAPMPLRDGLNYGPQDEKIVQITGAEQQLHVRTVRMWNNC